MIDELPDLPFGLILEELSYEDRFSLRKACKRLKTLIDGQVFRNLFVFLDCFPCHQTLFYVDEAVYYSNSCRVPDFERFISSKYKENFKLLRKLMITFEGLYRLENYRWDRNHIRIDSTTEQRFLQEVWRLAINLDHLNFFEQLDHLQIKGVGKVVGQLRLPKLRVLSVETRRNPSEFDLDCPRLRAMCISLGARPNFIVQPHELDCLSTKVLFGDDPFDYLEKLYEQCPRLTTVGFQCPNLLNYTLTEVNAGRLRLPQWRVIKLEQVDDQDLHSLGDDLIDNLLQYEKSVQPDSLQIIFNEKSISSELLFSIFQLYPKFTTRPNRLLKVYHACISDDETDPSFLISKISELHLSSRYIEPDDDLVMKLRNLQVLVIYSESPRIDEAIFGSMLTAFSKLEKLQIDRPSEQVGQHQLDRMPEYWPNLSSLVFTEKPESLKFVAELKNLRALSVEFNLQREEMMFLLQSCPSLYHIAIHNISTDFFNILYTKAAYKHSKFFTMFSRYFNSVLNSYKLVRYRRVDGRTYDRSFRLFNNLEQLADHYYDKNIFDRQDISSSKVIKDLFKLSLWN